jgi:UDP-N-acetylglucosamine 2-epimerase (non-hydrolysing)
MSSVAFVLGTRPEIIKTAPVILECKRRDISTALIHTGQHYSEELDDVFFEQLQLPSRYINLDVGSGGHGNQTGKMLAAIEDELLNLDPELVFVQGDTNSTVAGALAASKLEPAVAHIEAGLRSFDRDMPEETNRVIVDHISDYLFPPTRNAALQLQREDIPASRVTVTGNTIADAIERYSSLAATRSDILERLDLEPGEFCLLTAHRAENVDEPSRFEALLTGVDRYASEAGYHVVYPVHPRSESKLQEFDIAVPDSIRLVEPLGFFDFLRLESEASLVFTDSGGVQEETCILGTPCVTLRYTTERPETVHVGANCLSGLQPDEIVSAARQMATKSGVWESPFGDGKAAERIVSAVHSDQVSTDEESVLSPSP